MRVLPFILLGGALAGGLHGQIPVHDLGLEIVVDAPAITPPGSTGTVAFTVTNFGPEDAGLPPFGNVDVLVGDRGVRYSPILGEIIEYTRVPGTPCILNSSVPSPLPGEPLRRFHLIRFNVLPAGESIACIVEFTIHPQAADIAPDEVAAGFIRTSWIAGSARGDDPNPANNDLPVVYRLRASLLDVPTLSPVGLVLLAVSLSLAAILLRRRASSHPAARRKEK